MHEYEDMLNLPRPDSGRHARMRMIDRGAQFAPFAALTGYEAVIAETARRTEPETVLADGGEAMVDAALRAIAARLAERPQVLLTWFQPDARKPGGRLCRTRGIVRKLDLYAQSLLLEDGQEIPFALIKEVEFQPSEEEDEHRHTVRGDLSPGSPD